MVRPAFRTQSWISWSETKSGLASASQKISSLLSLGFSLKIKWATMGFDRAIRSAIRAQRVRLSKSTLFERYLPKSSGQGSLGPPTSPLRIQEGSVKYIFGDNRDFSFAQRFQTHWYLFRRLAGV